MPDVQMIVNQMALEHVVNFSRLMAQYAVVSLVTLTGKIYVMDTSTKIKRVMRWTVNN